MREELKVKEWVIRKEQEIAARYNVFIDYSRRTDDVENKPFVEDGCVFVKVEELLEETEKAIRVRLSSGDVVGSYNGWTLWIPKSQIFEGGIKVENMKGLDYLEEIKKDYTLSNEDLADICIKLYFIARDYGEDDTILCELSEMLYEA